MKKFKIALALTLVTILHSFPTTARSARVTFREILLVNKTPYKMVQEKMLTISPKSRKKIYPSQLKTIVLQLHSVKNKIVGRILIKLKFGRRGKSFTVRKIKPSTELNNKLDIILTPKGKTNKRANKFGQIIHKTAIIGISEKK